MKPSGRGDSPFAGFGRVAPTFEGLRCGRAAGRGRWRTLMRIAARVWVGVCAAVALSLSLSPSTAPAAVDELVLVSRESGAGGAGADDHSSLSTGSWSAPQSRISGDGRYVAFDSYANNLVALVDEAWPNGFLREENTSTTTLLNPHVPGTGAGHAVISADGTQAAFVTPAALSPEDTNGTADVYLRDIQSGTITLASPPSAELPFGAGGWAPSLSADGGRVAFQAANNVDGIPARVYVWDRGTNTTTLVSRQSGANGAPADGFAGGAAISADGRHVAFVSDATNLSVDDDAPDLDVFVRDLEADTTTLASSGTPFVSPYAFRPAIAADGRYVAFEAGDTDFGAPAVYRRDLQSNEPLIVVSGGAANGGGGAPSISANGNRVAFESGTNINVRDIQAERTMLASRRATADGGDVADGRSFWPAISGDGNYVAFESEANNLSDIDEDAVTDIFRARVSFDASPPDADVSLAKADSPDPVRVGEPLTYTLTLTNNGPADATDVTLTDTLPAGVTFGSATPSKGSCPESGDTRVRCDLGSLAPDASATVEVVVTPDLAGTLTNTASVDGEPNDPNPANNTAEESTTVEPAATGPALSIADVEVTERDAGTVNAEFEVSLSGVSEQDVTVEFETHDDTAEAPGDYEALSRLVTFRPGRSLTQKIPVPVKGDVLDESDEAFTAELTNPQGATIVDGHGEATIYDDDPAVECRTLRFGHSPTEDAIDLAGRIDCFSFDAADADVVRVRVVKLSGEGFEPRTTVRRPDRTLVPGCELTGSPAFECTLDRTGTHSILVRDAAGTHIGEYVIAIQRLNAPVGCTTLRFADPPTEDAIKVAGETDCFRFDGVDRDVVRVRMVKLSDSAGFFEPRAELRRPDGTLVPGCSLTGRPAFECMLDDTGPHTILIRDALGTNTGDYVIAIQRLNAPVGCTTLRIGDPPTEDAIKVAGETDCFRFEGADGDVVRVRMVKLSDSAGFFEPRAEFFRPAGTAVPGCPLTGRTDFTCTLDATGTHTILVRDATGTNAGRYTIQLGDRPPPPETTIDFGPSGPTNDPTPTFGFRSSAPGSTFQCRVIGGAFTEPFASCDSPFVTSVLDDGPYTFEVFATDAAGSDDPTPASRSFQIDTVAPQVTIRTPPEGAEYPRGAVVVADYVCSDEPGGSGLALCTGPVPGGEPVDTATLATKGFTVIARDNAGNESSVTHTYTVIDDTPPTITLRTPPDGATYTLNQDVNADYECADESGGSGLASCEGTVRDGAPIDTATLGVKNFTVTARDNAGNERSVTHQYRVTPRDLSAPRIEIRTPQAGAGYPRGAVVVADYECADEAGGSGLASCAGPVADGEPIDTATLGGKEFTVLARDNAGNQASVGVGYMVIDVTPPTVTLRSPPDGAVYDVGQEVRADYECADDFGGAGLASCAGPVADGDPIDTATAGPKSFTVTARDNAGNERSLTHRYTVSAPPRPLCDGLPATIVVPPDSGPVIGTPGADVIVGTEGSDVISGRGADDRICGRGGADQLTGDAGDDRLFGHEGNDQLAGGKGNDALLGGGGKDELGGGGGDDDLRGGDGDDRLRGEGDDDELRGDDGDDGLSGNDGNDALTGGGGKDLLQGRGGNDVLFGSGGHDELRGGDGNDRAEGEHGNDRLSGGRGNDRLFGGGGDDDIDGGPGRDLCRGGPGADSETDCEA
jgi:uncharacterized repeat protein (TIGR01451 family)